jgi:hypothetical protein
VFRIEREVEELSSGKQRREVSYGITSLKREEASAARLMEIVSGHWGIENGLRYRKDKTLREDACRLKRGEAAQVMAVINNLITGLVLKQGIRKLAGARRKYSAYRVEALNLVFTPVVLLCNCPGCLSFTIAPCAHLGYSCASFCPSWISQRKQPEIL